MLTRLHTVSHYLAVGFMFVYVGVRAEMMDLPLKLLRDKVKVGDKGSGGFLSYILKT